MIINWNYKKNEKLKQEREISFDEVMVAIYENRVLDIVEHPNKKKYPGQKFLIVNIKNYAYIIPFVIKEKECFFKTIIPSRKMTKIYITRRQGK